MHDLYGLPPQSQPDMCVSWSLEWLLRAVREVPATSPPVHPVIHTARTAAACYGTIKQAAIDTGYTRATDIQLHDFTKKPFREKLAELHRLWPANFIVWTIPVGQKVSDPLWHSMPVLELMPDSVTLLYGVDDRPTTGRTARHVRCTIAQLENFHNGGSGGFDFASIPM